MRKKIILLFLVIPLLLLLVNNSFVAKAEEKNFYLGGYSAGFTLYCEGAEIVGLCDVVNVDKVSSPSKECDLRVGDILLQIDEHMVNCAKDIENAVNNGKSKILKVKRKSEILIKSIKPMKDSTGRYKLGLFIKEGINGIGTITYFTDEEIGCLGHPILNESGDVLNVTGGKIVDCKINGIIKGVKGRAGELKGTFTNDLFYGNINKNCLKGVFANKDNSIKINNLKKIELASPQMGDAFIYCSLTDGKPEKYSISIIKVDNGRDDKNLVVKINDQRLLEETGGIVQGMSGSPIVQNNKLVGAVTHVFINDPTKGFADFITIK